MLRGGRQDVLGLKDFPGERQASPAIPEAGGAVEEAVERVLLQFASREKQEQLLTRLSNLESGLKNLGWDVTDQF